MDPDEVRRRWKPSGFRPADGSDWDRRVRSFDGPVPGEEDPFVSMVLRETPADLRGTDMLDIGCGAGRYTLALAGRVRSATGVDISPAMVAAAEARAASEGVGNTRFLTMDWSSADVRGLGDYGITIAHMTPAICSAGTFEKMLSVSRGICLLAGYINRGNPIWNKIYGITGDDGSDTESDKLLFAQDTLWRMGLEPRIEYIRRRRLRRISLEEAYDTYVGGARGYTELDAAAEGEIRDLLDGMAEDGFVTDASDPLIGVLIWNMSGEDDIYERG